MCNLKLCEGSCPARLYLLGGGDTLLPGLGPGLGHADGGALGVGHCVALAVRDRVVHSLAQGAGRIVATVAVGAVSETIGFNKAILITRSALMVILSLM